MDKSGNHVSCGVLKVRTMDPFAMYITQAELPPPVVIPRRKKRLKQLQLELEREYLEDVGRLLMCCVFINYVV